MANLKLRYLIVSVMLSVTAIVVSALQYDTAQDQTAGLVDLQKIPMQIGKWHGQDLMLDEKVYEILETRAIIHRNYMDDQGNSILLSIVHYNDTKLDFHAPEACLGGRGQGTTKTEKMLTIEGNKQKKSFEIAEIISQHLGHQTLSYYFYKAGDFLGQNYIQMRINIAKNRLFNYNSRGSLIRVSSGIEESSKKEREFLLEKFMLELIPILMIVL